MVDTTLLIKLWAGGNIKQLEKELAINFSRHAEQGYR